MANDVMDVTCSYVELPTWCGLHARWSRAIRMSHALLDQLLPGYTSGHERLCTSSYTMTMLTQTIFASD